jgi:hypothetical protein
MHRLVFLARCILIISTSKNSSATFYSHIRILFWENEGWFFVVEKKFIIFESSAFRDRFQKSHASLRSRDHEAPKKMDFGRPVEK